MDDNDFGTAFSGSTSSTPRRETTEPLRITPEEIEHISTTIQPVSTIDNLSKESMLDPVRLAEKDYGLQLQSPSRKEDLFVGLTRNPNMRSEEEKYFPIFSSQERSRQHQIFTFLVEISDNEGNPVEFIPIEVRGQSISGALPSDGSPVAVYGKRDEKDGVVRTYKVINLQTKSSLTVTKRPKDVCFIATAVYGSVDAPKVRLLRLYRDQYLLQTGKGKFFVRLYYRLSPPLALMIQSHPRLKRFARYWLDKIVDKIDAGWTNQKQLNTPDRKRNN